MGGSIFLVTDRLGELDDITAQSLVLQCQGIKLVPQPVGFPLYTGESPIVQFIIDPAFITQHLSDEARSIVLGGEDVTDQCREVFNLGHGVFFSGSLVRPEIPAVVRIISA
jgi:hypothetical protein